jgi:Flp pilus assembly protein TadD
MAEAEVKLSVGDHPAMLKPSTAVNPHSAFRIPHWKRWNDYGIGLLEQAQYGQAADAFRRASALNPSDPIRG